MTSIRASPCLAGAAAAGPAAGAPGARRAGRRDPSWGRQCTADAVLQEPRPACIWAPAGGAGPPPGEAAPREEASPPPTPTGQRQGRQRRLLRLGAAPLRLPDGTGGGAAAAEPPAPCPSLSGTHWSMTSFKLVDTDTDASQSLGSSADQSKAPQGAVLGPGGGSKLRWETEPLAAGQSGHEAK
ncbi:unnamed protein product [Prorocentrum cordatum]|uniref:Uncharacterized protein n=1 Tax=Prorocentrum cordatum TaxID=2364126 RepID=A0ABN9UXP9_9DINO|nr:unnamed protein product [Polarella glacialis]